MSTLIKTGPVLLVPPQHPANSVKELVEQAKKKPSPPTFANTGIGSSSHLASELLKLASGVNFPSIPYKGDTPAIADLLGGHVDQLFVPLTAALPQVKGGKLKALAITSEQRASSLPDVPTMIESGYKDVNIASWIGLAGPANLPAPILKKLNREVQAVLQEPEVRDRLLGMGLTPTVESPKEAADFIASEVSKYSKVVKESNIVVR